ncbi:MAG: hypothetical protein FWG77_05105 [Treponema sp.]|nr:hypothetical protein [Treponema sp.]
MCRLFLASSAFIIIRINTLHYRVKHFTLYAEMNRLIAIEKLTPVFDHVLSPEIKAISSFPILQEFAALSVGSKNTGQSIIINRIKRRYLRLCRVQEELSRLDFKNAKAGVSPEDYVFSKIDFSRYREIHKGAYESLFLESLSDFSDTFLIENFGSGRDELRNLIENSYKKAESICVLIEEKPLIISLMRTLETSLDDMPLFSDEEIANEVKSLPPILQQIESIYILLVFCLDGLSITHKDGMITELFVSVDGNLSATFRPGGKPWTRVLINNLEV